MVIQYSLPLSRWCDCKNALAAHKSSLGYEELICTISISISTNPTSVSHSGWMKNSFMDKLLQYCEAEIQTICHLFVYIFHIIHGYQVPSGCKKNNSHMRR